MIPQTVPNSPMNGVAPAVVARKPRLFSSSVTWTDVFLRSTRSSAPIVAASAASPAGGFRLISRNAARNSPASGLAVSVAVASWIEASPPPFLKRSRKTSDSRCARANVRQRSRMIPHDMTENATSTKRMNFAMGPESMTSAHTSSPRAGAARKSGTRAWYAKASCEAPRVILLEPTASRVAPMLKTLRVRNLVTIEDLEVEFAPGLNVLTGETGAGKSILVDALGLAAGERADAALLRGGAERAVVEATFVAPDTKDLLEARGLDASEDAVIVRREIGAGGRVVVNGSPTTVAVLR